MSSACVRWLVQPSSAVVLAVLSLSVSGFAAVIAGGKNLIGRLATSDGPATSGAKDGQRSNVLPAIPTPPDAVELDIVFVERPSTDPLLGRALWQEVEQAGAVALRQREMLGKNGFRVGHASATPPRALETLLGLKAEISDDPASKKLVTQRIMIRSGGEAEIEASTSPRCGVTIVNDEGDRQADYENARCVLRVKAEKLQDGWVKLAFVPEIDHGMDRLRPLAVQTNLIETAWQTRTSQKVDPLFSQCFEMTLNVGEFAVISATKPAAGESIDVEKDANTATASVGERFFVTSQADARLQRLLVVRLARITEAQPGR